MTLEGVKELVNNGGELPKKDGFINAKAIAERESMKYLIEIFLAEKSVASAA